MFVPKSIANFSVGLTYFEHWLQAWLSVNECNILTFGYIICFYVSLCKWAHLCGEKNVISLKIYCALPTLFWSQVRQMQHSFCIYFLQDIYHISWGAYRSITTDQWKVISIVLIHEITVKPSSLIQRLNAKQTRVHKDAVGAKHCLLTVDMKLSNCLYLFKSHHGVSTDGSYR